MFERGGLQSMVHVADAIDPWHLLHTNLGPVSICFWYRFPGAGTSHIDDVEAKSHKDAADTLGCLVFGDMSATTTPG